MISRVGIVIRCEGIVNEGRMMQAILLPLATGRSHFGYSDQANTIDMRGIVAILLLSSSDKSFISRTTAWSTVRGHEIARFGQIRTESEAVRNHKKCKGANNDPIHNPQHSCLCSSAHEFCRRTFWDNGGEERSLTSDRLRRALPFIPLFFAVWELGITVVISLRPSSNHARPQRHGKNMPNSIRCHPTNCHRREGENEYDEIAMLIPTK